jgi:hypothetical protein
MMVASFLLALAVASTPQQPATDTTFEVDARGRLDVENQDGSILVRSWDRSAVRVRTEGGAAAEIDIDNVGSIVRVEPRDRRGGRNGRVDLDVTVPRGFGIIIDAQNGDIVLEDIGGSVEAETFNGNIVLRGGNGTISLETMSGEIIVDGARGSLHAETMNRGIRISRTEGDIDAEAVNGGILMSDIRSANVQAESVNGEIRYDGDIRSGGRYRLSTHNGSLTMTVPDGTGAAFSVVTHSGTIQTDFAVQLQSLNSRRNVSFRLGDGSARVELESFNGSIRLRRPGNR